MDFLLFMFELADQFSAFDAVFLKKYLPCFPLDPDNAITPEPLSDDDIVQQDPPLSLPQPNEPNDELSEDVLVKVCISLCFERI